jgi:dephospho-CoA kinase
MVIEADALVREAYDDPAVQRTLLEWWGDEVFHADGSVHRANIARRVFNDPEQRRRLEGLLHPWVITRRRVMQEEADPGVVAFIWDTPLLFETGLNRECDAVVFVDTPEEERIRRVVGQRGWDAAELRRRENLQMPLDKKRGISDYVLINTTGAAEKTAVPAGDTRTQVQEILSRVVSGLPNRPDRAYD